MGGLYLETLTSQEIGTSACVILLNAILLAWFVRCFQLIFTHRGDLLIVDGSGHRRRLSDATAALSAPPSMAGAPDVIKTQAEPFSSRVFPRRASSVVVPSDIIMAPMTSHDATQGPAGFLSNAPQFQYPDVLIQQAPLQGSSPSPSTWNAVAPFPSAIPGEAVPGAVSPELSAVVGLANSPVADHSHLSDGSAAPMIMHRVARRTSAGDPQFLAAAHVAPPTGNTPQFTGRRFSAPLTSDESYETISPTRPSSRPPFHREPTQNIRKPEGFSTAPQVPSQVDTPTGHAGIGDLL